MANGKRPAIPLRSRLTFFLEFLKSPLQIGSVTPSSRFLEQRIMKSADITSAGTIIELGPGTGGTTRAILHAMPPQARLLCVELNPLFYRLIRSIQDNRLTAHLGSAAELKDILVLHGLPAPDVIISGIPFSTMSRSTGSGILATIATLLAPGGRFVAYQASDRVVDLSEPFLGTGQTQLEFLNIPPMRVCRWEKPDTRTDTGTDSSAPGRQHRAEDTYR